MSNAASSHSKMIDVPGLRRRLVAGVFLLNLIVSAVLANSFWQSYQQHRGNAEITSRNLAQVLAQDMESTITKADFGLQASKDEIERQLAGGKPDAAALQTYMTRMLQRLPWVIGLRATDEHGWVSYGVDVPRTGKVSNADRPHYLVHRDNRDYGLFVGKPVLSKINKVWVLNVSRRLNYPDGRFGGDVFANIPLSSFSKIFEQIDIGQKGAINLRYQDMSLILRKIGGQEQGARDYGALVGRQDISGDFRTLLEAGHIEEGTFYSPASFDGTPRIVSYRKISTYPLYVTVGLAEEEYLAEWHNEAEQVAWLTLLFALISGGGAWLLTRGWQRQADAAERLVREEEKFHTIADFTNDWEYLEDRERALLYVSPSCERVTGHAPAEFLADPGLLLRIVHPDDRPMMEARRCDPAQQEAAEFDFRIVRKDGEIRWINHRCRPVTGPDGDYRGLRVSNRDVTDRRLFEAEINRLAQAVEQSPAGICITDAEGKPSYTNQAYTRLTGYTFAEAYDLPPRELLSSGMEDADYEEVRQRLAAGRPWNDVVPYRHKNGDQRWHRLSVAPIYDESGRIASHLYLRMDITEQVRGEEALLASRNELQQLLHNLPVAIVVHGPDTAIRYGNPIAQQILGLSEDQLLGRTAMDPYWHFVREDGTPLPPEEYPVNRVLARKEDIAGQVLGVIVTRDAAPRWVYVSAFAERDVQGEVRQVVVSFMDISERQEMEEEIKRYRDHLEDVVQQRTAELVQARDEAEAANRAKSVFLASMSHELRTPLNAILGFSSMIRRDERLPDSHRQSLDIINRSGEHLLTLINDVLEMAKIEAGRIRIEVQPFDLGGMVRDVTDMMRQRAEEKGLRLLIDQSSQFPRFIVSDEARLRQVLINLIGNAVKFTEQGGVTLRLGVKPNHHTHLLIEVEDTGIGIAAEDLQRIFEPFVQVGAQRSNKGTGLGLTITRQYVQMMGGDITVESTPDKGSLFRIDLPLQAATEGEIAKPKAAQHGEVTGLAPGQPEYRVLIAEDQEENQLLLAQLMENIGVKYRIAGNGEQAVQMFREWHPHLIWMDRRMPLMDGEEATRAIRQLPGGAEVKIVAVTASAFVEQRDEMMAAGMDDFVRKPYRFNEIYDCLARQLGLKFIYAGGEAAAPEEPLTPTMLSALPQELCDELRDALESLESKRIADALQRVGALDPQLGGMLARLVDRYDYPAILDALNAMEK